jgi:hypothetical protein
MLVFSQGRRWRRVGSRRLKCNFGLLRAGAGSWSRNATPRDASCCLLALVSIRFDLQSRLQTSRFRVGFRGSDLGFGYLSWNGAASRPRRRHVPEAQGLKPEGVYDSVLECRAPPGRTKKSRRASAENESNTGRTTRPLAPLAGVRRPTGWVGDPERCRRCQDLRRRRSGQSGPSGSSLLHVVGSFPAGVPVWPARARAFAG